MVDIQIVFIVMSSSVVGRLEVDAHPFFLLRGQADACCPAGVSRNSLCTSEKWPCFELGILAARHPVTDSWFCVFIVDV